MTTKKELRRQLAEAIELAQRFENIADELLAERNTLRAQRDSLLDDLDTTRNELTLTSAALTVALEQGEKDREASVVWRQRAENNGEHVEHYRSLSSRRHATVDAQHRIIVAMLYVGDRMAEHLGAGFNREWDAAKTGVLLRDPDTGRMRKTPNTPTTAA